MSPTHLDGRCRLSPRRRLALGGTVLTSTLALGLLVAPAAQAIEPASTTVSTKADLAAAFDSGTAKIVLGASLTETAPSPDQDTETVPANTTVTLDLKGYSLALDRIVLDTNSTLTITDSTQSTGWDDDEEDRDENALRVDAGAAGGTAIEVGDGASLKVTRATVRATGGADGAGIGSAANTTGSGSLKVSESGYVRAAGGDGGAGVGGGRGAKAIDVTVSGADLVATGGDGGAGIGSGDGGTGGSLRTVAPTGSANYGYSSIDAEGGDDAAGIGGGRDSAGGTIDLESYGSVSAQQGASTGTSTPSAVGAGAGGTGFGSLTVGEDASLDLYSGSATHLPSDALVENAGDIFLGGTIDGAGTIRNDGSIDPQSRYDDDGDRIADTVQHIAPTVKILNHNYRVTLDPNGGTASTDAVVDVWSGTFRGYRYAEPTKSDGTVFFNWSTRADTTGEDASYLDLQDATGTTSADGTPVPVTLFARYGHPAKMTATTLPDAGTGQTYDQPFPATGDGLDYFGVQDTDDEDRPIVALPPGLALNRTTGRISGVPTQPGTYTFRVWAGGDHTSTDGTLTIEVAGAPVFATSTLPAGTAGTAYTSTVQATGAGRIAYSVVSGALPAGLSLDESTGRVSGTPTAAGAAAFVVRAASSFGSTLQPLTLTIGAATAPAATAPAAAAPAATAPVLAGVPRTTVRFGHRLDLAVTAASTVPVTYRVVAGSLPEGVTLDSGTGVVSGIVAEVGGFSATIEASSAAGSARADVAVDVPPVTELLSTATVPDVKVGAGKLPLKVKGLKKGEGWTVLVDGKPVKHGTMRKAGTLSTAVKLPKAKHDTVHVIEISGSRPVADPAERASTSAVITSLAAKKTLSVKTTTAADGTKRVVVDRLAAGEKVTVKAKARTIAKGVADSDGTFAFAQSKAGKGKRTLTVKGASAGRHGRLTVANPKH